MYCLNYNVNVYNINKKKTLECTSKYTLMCLCLCTLGRRNCDFESYCKITDFKNRKIFERKPYFCILGRTRGVVLCMNSIIF